MKRTLAIIAFFIFSNFVHAQIDFKLSRCLDSLAEIDQKWRVLMRQIGNNETDTLSYEIVVKNLLFTDSCNFFVIQDIFNRHGFPGYDKVGGNGAHSFWLLVQHADRHPGFQEQVLESMKVEAERGNASLSNYAYLVDRVKVNTGQLQIYGTQLRINSGGTSYEPLPTTEPEMLNTRRQKVGLSSIEEYIQGMNESHYGELKK